MIQTTCTIEVNNTNKNEGVVQLGTWMTNTFDKVGELTDAVPLTIGLSGCPATLARARVTFGGTAHPDNNQLYAVNEAEGVGIGISGDVNGTNFYTPDTEADGIDLKGNSGKKHIMRVTLQPQMKLLLVKQTLTLLSLFNITNSSLN
ncbi:fimbrial protein [Providencia hangzhouensis]